MRLLVIGIAIFPIDPFIKSHLKASMIIMINLLAIGSYNVSIFTLKDLCDANYIKYNSFIALFLFIHTYQAHLVFSINFGISSCVATVLSQCIKGKNPYKNNAMDKGPIKTIYDKMVIFLSISLLSICYSLLFYKILRLNHQKTKHAIIFY